MRDVANPIEDPFGGSLISSPLEMGHEYVEKDPESEAGFLEARTSR